VRRAARTDSNHQAIVDALRGVGVHVESIGKPVDLLCSYRDSWFVVEIKNAEGKNQLTKEQVEFIGRSQGPVHIVRTPDEAIAAVLGKEVMA
jgi:hypothetical protein